MIQEKLPSASARPVINQGFKLSLVGNPVLLIRHSFLVLLEIYPPLTVEEVEYLLQDVLVRAKRNCLDLTKYLSWIIDRSYK